MDDIVRSVQETWVEDDPSRPSGMQFLGSDDFLRAKFEDYICSALSGIKYADFLAKGAKNDVLISGAPNSTEVITRFGEAFIAGFRQTRCGKLWDRTTDPVLFDICEPRHPCDNPPSLASDIGLRLTEGLHELNLEERMAPAREVLNTAWTSGLTAAAGLQANIAAGIQSRFGPQTPSSTSASAAEVTTPSQQQQQQMPRPGTGLRQLSLVRESLAPALQQGASAASEGAKGVAGVVGGWGSFIAGRVGSLAQAQSPTTPTGPAPPPAPAPVTPSGARPPANPRSFSFWDRKSADGVSSTPTGGAAPALLSVTPSSGSASARTSIDGPRPPSRELEDQSGVSRGSSWSWLSRTSSSSNTSTTGERERAETPERSLEGLPDGARAV